MAGNEKKILFQAKKLRFDDESDGNNFKLAALKRSITAHDFYGSIALENDDEFTCQLLKRNLDTCSTLTDDPNGVNNYVEKVLDLIPNNTNGQQKLWKCSISTSQVLGFLTPLPCSKEKTDQCEQINCVNGKMTAETIKAIHRARSTYREDYSREPRRKVPETPEGSFPSSSHNNSQFQTRNPHQNSQKNPQVNKFQPPTAKVVPTFQPKNIFCEPTPPKPPTTGIFKTASAELRIQNVKKYGRDNGRPAGAGKRLGLSKSSGVSAPFQNPYQNHSSSNETEKRPPAAGALEGIENMEVAELAADERLKNVEPKMIETILNEIVYNGVTVTWDDIAGLDYAKNTIQEVVVWPMLRPDIFTGLRRPPRGILLFGPPGTGKTLIGKCIAFESGATFFSISASSLTSKWIGECEKMVRALFAVARAKQPSVVFIDEIDSILTQRSDTEHESSRRMKTEFLVQLDGVGTGDEDRILIIGATNRPQELDEAARRRLVKRLYVPLPEVKARSQMIQKIMKDVDHQLSSEDIERVAEMTDGYSGADMMCVCKEAAYEPIRSIPRMQIKNINFDQVRPVQMSDFTTALTRVRATVSQEDLHHYLAWDKQFGSGSA